MEHFPSVYTILDGPAYTTIPSVKKEYSSECALQFAYRLFKNRQEFAHFNQKGEIEFLCNRV